MKSIVNTVSKNIYIQHIYKKKQNLKNTKEKCNILKLYILFTFNS